MRVIRASGSSIPAVKQRDHVHDSDPARWHDTWAFGPFYLRRKNPGWHAGLLPLFAAGSDKVQRYTVVPPLLFGDVTNLAEGRRTTISPLFARQTTRDGGRTLGVLNLFWDVKRANDERPTVMFPLLYRRQHGERVLTITPLGGGLKTRDRATWMATPLLYGARDRDGKRASFGFIPLAFYDRRPVDGGVATNQRMVNNDRNIFGALMVANGDADGLVTGVTRTAHQALQEVKRAIDHARRQRPIGVSMMVAKHRTLFIADTSVCEMPEAEDLAQIAIEAAGCAKRLGFTPRVAFLAFSTFGRPMGERSAKCREAVAILDSRDDIDLEYEGEMTADVALDEDSKKLYPFSRLTGPANVLVMPAIHSAHISTRLMETWVKQLLLAL